MPCATSFTVSMSRSCIFHGCRAERTSSIIAGVLVNRPGRRHRGLLFTGSRDPCISVLVREGTRNNVFFLVLSLQYICQLLRCSSFFLNCAPASVSISRSISIHLSLGLRHEHLMVNGFAFLYSSPPSVIDVSYTALKQRGLLWLFT